MRLRGSPAAISLLAAGALLLSACGSDDNTTAAATGGGSSASAPGGSRTGAARVSCGGTKSLKASGSSAQANAMTRFQAAYSAACPGYTLDYTTNGSGKGVAEFTGGQTDIGGSDSPLNAKKGEPAAAEKRCGAPAWNLPVVYGPIAVTYNLEGVTDLVLDGPTLGKIFNGGITTWNDPAIAKLNPGATLPAEPIAVIYRNDESGTTDNFQSYLESASDGSWTQGTGKVFAGGVGSGAKGNEGTSAAIKTTEGSITYNEFSFVQSQKLGVAKIVTSAGPDPVEITNETVGKTISGAKVKGAGNDLVLDTTSFYRPSETGAYPIVLATYEIVCSKYADADTATAVRAFLTSTIGAGQRGLSDNGYVPVPEQFKVKLATAIDAIS